MNVRIRGYDAPLFAFIGGTFTALSFVVICALSPTVALAGIGWLVLGIVVITSSTARSMGLDLTSTHKVAIPQPVVDHEAEYDSVLVAIGAEEGYNGGIVATATKLAAAAPARHPRARHHPGAVRAGDRRADGRRRGAGGLDDRAGARSRAGGA